MNPTNVEHIHIDGEGTFHSTWKPNDKEEAERIAKAHGGVVKPFGVKLNSYNPKTNKATDWKKVKGFSVFL